MNLRLIRPLKDSRLTSNRFGINILLQGSISINLKGTTLILPDFCSFLTYGIHAGSTLFREYLKSPTSFVGILTHINIFSLIFSRMKLGRVNTMWMVLFMLKLRWNVCETCLIQMTSKLDLFFWRFSSMIV